MSEPNEEVNGSADAENPGAEACCAPGCDCNSGGAAGRVRRIVGIVILAVAGVLVARAVMKDNGSQAVDDTAAAGFTALPEPVTRPAETPDARTAAQTDTLKELESLSDLNSVADDTSGVFVFLPGKGETVTTPPMEQLRSAARTIEPQLRGGKIGMFVLKAGSRDYEQLAMQTAVPGVVAMVKGGGMSPTSGDVTETKLVQAFVAASRAGGCGSSAGSGCCP